MYQRCFYCDVVGGFALAIVYGSHAMPGLYTQVPHGSHESLDHASILAAGLLVQQDQHVDIRVRVQFATPIPSRSEEHTSELQSLMRISYAVFCLKKKKHKN